MGKDTYRNTMNDRRENTLSPKNNFMRNTAAVTLIVMLGSTVGKIINFLQSIINVQVFGMSQYSDALTQALRIPDLFYLLLMGGAIQAAIVPTLSKAIGRGHDAEKNAWRGVSIFISIMSVILILFIIMGILFAPTLFPVILKTQYSRFPDTIRLAARASQFLFPQVFFMMLAALCIGILNAYKKFASSAFGPTIYSIFVAIFTIIWGEKTDSGVTFVSLGITISAIIFFIYQLFMSRDFVRNFRFSLDWRDKSFRRVFSLAFPTMLSGSAIQINNILMDQVAGSLGTGFLTSKDQAFKLWQLPYGIFVVAIGSVMMPSLASFCGARDYRSSRKLFSKSLRNALFLSIPSAFLLFILRSDVIDTMFNWGNYSPEDIRRTANLLMGYCIALVAHTVVFMYNQAFIAAGKTKVPLAIAVLSLILTYIFSRLFLFLGMAETGISFGYSAAAIVSAVVLISLYKLQLPKYAPRNIMYFLIRTLICSCVMMLVVYVCGRLPVEPEGKLLSVLWFIVRGGLGLGAYVFIAAALHMKELDVLFGRLKKKSVR